VAGQGRPACAALEMAGVRPGSSWQFTERVVLGAPGPKPFTLAVSPGATSDWALTAQLMGPDCDNSGRTDRYSVNAAFRTPGTGRLAFGRAPFGPALAQREPGSFRYGFWADDTLVVRVPLFADAGPGHYGPPLDSGYAEYPYVTGQTRLYDSAGQLIVYQSRPGHCSCYIPAGSVPPGPLRMEVDADRAAPWSGLAVRQRLAWTFHADPGQDVVPLLAVRYRIPLDAANRAPGGTRVPIALWVERPEPPGPAVASAGLEASFDDGATWSRVPLTGAGDARTAVLRHPARGYVSLRATAADTAGNSVTQTLIRAYAVAPPTG
jgi:hypothetical protein